MKTIKKIKNNLGKVAGSALLVGATVAGGAAMVSAQDNGSSGSLGDYPAPFVNDDGEVDTSVVVGETAEDGNPVSTLDVVAGVEIAGSLGNAAFVETEEQVSVEGGAAEWSAENGVTLNTLGQDLFLLDETNSGETLLDDRDLDVLESSNFDADGDSVEVTHEVEVGQQSQAFSTDPRDLDSPELHVDVPTRGSVGEADDEHLLNLRTEMDTVDVEDVDDDETITLFSEEFVINQDDTGDGVLALFGDSETFEVSSGSEDTFTVEGNEHTVEVISVGDTNAQIRVDGGSRQNVAEGESFRVSGQDVRARTLFEDTDRADGAVVFATGSQEVEFHHEGNVRVDGDRVRGTNVQFINDDNVNEFEGMDVYFGGQERNDDHVAAGDNYVDTVFGAVEFHYGGLEANAAENPAETVEVSADEEAVEAEFTNDRGYSTAVQYVGLDANDDFRLGSDDGDIATYEGQVVERDGFVPLNTNQRGSMWEVTDIFVDAAGNEEDEGSYEVTLENVFSGDVVEIEAEDVDFDDNDAVEERVRIDGNRYDVTFYDPDSEAAVDEEDGAISIVRSDQDGHTVVYPNLYTETDHAAAFTTEIEWAQTDFETVMEETGTEFRLPSTRSSSNMVVDLDDEATDNTDLENIDTEETVYFSAGEVEYVLDINFGDDEVSFGVSDDQVDDGEGDALGPSSLFMEPQDDDDAENAFVVSTNVDTENDEVEDIEVTYTSENYWTDEDEDDLELGYTNFGTYTQFDDDDEGDFTANLVATQSTSGMAVTGSNGSLSAQGGAASGSVMSQSPTYEFASGVLDSDSDTLHRAGDDHLILVGGPSVNQLVADLAEDGETWTADEYTEGEGLIQMIPNYDGDRDAVIVAGHSGEDTRAAGEFLANYRDHGADLEGETQVTISTETGQVVN